MYDSSLQVQGISFALKPRASNPGLTDIEGLFFNSPLLQW